MDSRQGRRAHTLIKENNQNANVEEEGASGGTNLVPTGKRDLYFVNVTYPPTFRIPALQSSPRFSPWPFDLDLISKPARLISNRNPYFPFRPLPVSPWGLGS